VIPLAEPDLAARLPTAPPFTVRARVLSPLPGGRTRDVADALVDVDAAGRITGVVDAAGVGADRVATSVDLRPLVVLPGLIDLHAHLPQVPNAGLGYGLPLLGWLDRLTFPTERAWADPAVAERLAPAIFRAFAAAGTTTVLGYGVVYEAAVDAAFRAAEAHGIRAILGKVMMDRITYDRAIDPRSILPRSVDESRRLAERWHGADGGRLGYAVAPRFAISCTADLLAASADLADQIGCWWQTHLAEDPHECAEVARLFPESRDYVDVYERAGGLGPKAILAHAIHLSPSEEARVAAAGARIAHCPTSNAFLGAGVMALSSRLAAGITVGLGSDVSGGSELSLFGVMRAGAYAQQARRALVDGEASRFPTALDPLDWLRLGTLDGARALGLEDRIGSIEAGKDADLIAVDPRRTAPLGFDAAGRSGGLDPDADLASLADPELLASRLIFRADPTMVRAAWVRGRRLEGPT
jgi:guanine deaminase